MAPRVGVVLFPGTNCEHDAIQAVERLGATADLVNVFWPVKTPEDVAESGRQRRKDRGVRAALERVLAAAGLKK